MASLCGIRNPPHSLISTKHQVWLRSSTMLRNSERDHRARRCSFMARLALDAGDPHLQALLSPFNWAKAASIYMPYRPQYLPKTPEAADGVGLWRASSHI